MYVLHLYISESVRLFWGWVSVTSPQSCRAPHCVKVAFLVCWCWGKTSGRANKLGLATGLVRSQRHFNKGMSKGPAKRGPASWTFVGNQLKLTPFRCIPVKRRRRAAVTIDLTSPSHRPRYNGTGLVCFINGLFVLYMPAVDTLECRCSLHASVCGSRLTTLWDNLWESWESGSPAEGILCQLSRLSNPHQISSDGPEQTLMSVGGLG